MTNTGLDVISSSPHIFSISQDRLRVLLEYDPGTGLFTWKSRPNAEFRNTRIALSWNGRFPGTRAGATCGHYVRICVDSTYYSAHSLAWLYCYGEHAPEIDHINGRKQDNRIANLRPCTRSENSKNHPLRKDNTSGIPGVSYAQNMRKWHVYVTDNCKRVTLGHYDNIFEAACARKSAEARLGYHANHGRVRV